MHAPLTRQTNKQNDLFNLWAWVLSHKHHITLNTLCLLMEDNNHIFTTHNRFEDWIKANTHKIDVDEDGHIWLKATDPKDSGHTKPTGWNAHDVDVFRKRLSQHGITVSKGDANMILTEFSKQLGHWPHIHEDVFEEDVAIWIDSLIAHPTR